MNYKTCLQKLYKVESKIEDCYLELAEIEACGAYDEHEHNTIKVRINTLVNDEKKLLELLFNLSDYITLKNQITMDKEAPKEPLISLGHLTNSYHFRLLNILEALSGDELLQYASTLKSDINHIILLMTEFLINNPYYEEIKEDLITLKHNLTFMDYNLESDFLMDIIDFEVELLSKNYRTNDMPSYEYVDKSILVLETINYLETLESIPENMISPNIESIVIITILNILARLTLCEERELNMVYPRLQALLESEYTSEIVKTKLTDMFAILNNVKSSFNWSRDI